MKVAIFDNDYYTGTMVILDIEKDFPVSIENGIVFTDSSNFIGNTDLTPFTPEDMLDGKEWCKYPFTVLDVRELFDAEKKYTTPELIAMAIPLLGNINIDCFCDIPASIDTCKVIVSQ